MDVSESSLHKNRQKNQQNPVNRSEPAVSFPVVQRLSGSDLRAAATLVAGALFRRGFQTQSDLSEITTVEEKQHFTNSLYGYFHGGQSSIGDVQPMAGGLWAEPELLHRQRSH